MGEPRKTALCDRHVALGARMVDFNGWWLPVQYAGILEEHRAVREQAGIFDVSHMGEIRVVGVDAARYMQKLAANNLADLATGKVKRYRSSRKLGEALGLSHTAVLKKLKKYGIAFPTK